MYQFSSDGRRGTVRMHSMKLSRVGIAIASVIGLVACGAAPVATQSSAGATASEATATPRSTEAVPTNSPANGGAATFDYMGLRAMAQDAGGVAVVKVTNIGDLQYNTADGQRPAEGTPLSGSISVGRIVEVKLIRLASGSWVSGDVARYWQPGGTLGSDTTPEEGYMGLPRPELNQTMVAFLLPQTADLDPTDSELYMDIFALFPVSASGRITTPDPKERVTTDSLDAAVR